MYENIDFDSIDTTLEPPAGELERQYYYIAKARTYVKELERELARKPLFCVTTFGCQMNTEHEIEKAA